MGQRPVSRGERLSKQYGNPTFDYDEDQATTAMLLQDLRKMVGGGLAVLVVFGVMLGASGSWSAALNLFYIAGFPLLLILLIGEFVRRRRARNYTTH